MSKPIHIKPEVVKNIVVIRVESISTDWEKYVVDIDPVPVDKPLRLIIWLNDTQEKIRPDSGAIEQEVVANGEDSETESETSEDMLIKSKGVDDPEITLVIPETNTEIDSKTYGSDSEIMTYHAKPARVLTIGHYPEGYSGPRVVTDYRIGEAFPPMIPTVEEFFTMLRERELEYGFTSDSSDSDK